MKKLLIYNIGLLLVDTRRRPFLAGREMGEAEILHNAWLLIEDGRFKDWGEGEAPLSPPEGGTIDETFRGKTIVAPSGAEGGASRVGTIDETSRGKTIVAPSGAEGGASRVGTIDETFLGKTIVAPSGAEGGASRVGTIDETSRGKTIVAPSGAEGGAFGAFCAFDAQGGAVLPSFCDSHTHLVYAGSREGEFVDKIQGLSYAEIARRGGGILNSADRLHAMSEDELFRRSMLRIDEIMKKGTGAVEIKSGYGLNTEDELKMLRVIRRIKETSKLKVVSTFLGAHAVGRGYTQEQYVDIVVNEMIPEVAREGLADFIDVFCDEGFFTPAETRRILEAGMKYGLRGKIHGQELADSGGVEVAVECGALSVDHLESMTDRDIAMLMEAKKALEAPPSAPEGATIVFPGGEGVAVSSIVPPSGGEGGAVLPPKVSSIVPPSGGERGAFTIPTVLPGTSFFLNMPFAPARKMIDSGLPLALASDYNPGSTPSGDMKFVVSLACIKQRLLPVEAIHAATLNSACAMGLSRDYGSIARGKVANFYITDPIPSLDFLPYAYTTNVIRRVYLSSAEKAVTVAVS